ncbi:MAG: cytochrome d ubiquinol oxidase subunit II [Bacteroidetes bacterium RIFOXYB2_FULL_35_7]|nr:MAG: cytochrome d ubiquinol oxidase subunit II [Bacteroidetes bacterium GWF2_35_48]OFY95748.1 MAG: cytochrome d ubiquinol oxidase subunit II [Bacteroidetes bacterium RIFOXYB2_FULL_35_7]OFZ01362.1 MAG: cytochrome d ubiquinol oxidase subunit II [Bacteroidetes bacterium RIFOXYC12_FULL_35_7]HBX49722.1 cytochrome d ubiquinol oxidase subunit II [Bacteroidales bacterium]
MFENLSIETLQNYWWIIISLLGSLLVFLMFVQGGQTLIWQIGKTENEKSLLINSIGKKWDLTFTTLVTFGGAFFASFPLFYSTSFGGAYWVWMLILFGFILQAVSFEYRKKAGNFLGAKTYEFFLLLNGILAPVLIGAAVSTFFTGSDFFVNEYNLSRWEHPARGLEAALNIQNLSLGLAVFFLTRIIGAQFFILTIDQKEIAKRAKKQILLNTIPFLITFLTFVVLLLLKDGFAVNPDTGIVSIEAYKYLHNLLQMPLVLILFFVGVILVLTGIYFSILKNSSKGINFSGAGAILTAFSLFMLAGFNNTAFYPSTFDLQSSLTIRNSSSSHYTLAAMSYVSLFVPFVIAYIWWAWRALTKKKMTEQEIEEIKNEGGHLY